MRFLVGIPRYFWRIFLPRFIYWFLIWFFWLFFLGFLNVFVLSFHQGFLNSWISFGILLNTPPDIYLGFHLSILPQSSLLINQYSRICCRNFTQNSFMGFSRNTFRESWDSFNYFSRNPFKFPYWRVPRSPGFLQVVIRDSELRASLHNFTE